METPQDEIPYVKDLVLTPEDRGYLHIAGQWARVLALFGFFVSALIVIFSLFIFFLGNYVFEAYNSFGSLGYGIFPLISFVYLLFGCFYFWICLKLFRFGLNVQIATSEGSQLKLEYSLLNLKDFFALCAYSIIGILLIYAFIFVVAFFI
jgi:hypothetical protein